jgi:uncharacterized protein (TIGR03435 family)
MLQNLLSDRKGLMCHFEKQDMRVSYVTLSDKGLSKAVRLSTEPPPESIDTAYLKLRESLKEMIVETKNSTISELLNDIARMAKAPLIDSTGLGNNR